MAAAKTKKPVVKVNGVTANRQTAATQKALSSDTVISSDSSGSDLDDDSDSDDLDTPAALPPKPKAPANATKISMGGKKVDKEHQAVSSEKSESAGDSSSSEGEIEPDRVDGAKLSQANGVKRKNLSQEETSGEEALANKRVRVNGEVDTQTTSEVERRAYLPPNGYRRVEKPSTSSISVKSFQHKTVFHIAAPAALPISLLESINVAAMRPGKSLFSHEGTEYMLVEAPVQQTAILLPDDDAVKVATQSLMKRYDIRPSFTLPTIPARAAARNAGSAVAANIATAAVTSIRPQPKGLKMRYKPPGFGRGNPGVIGLDADDHRDDRESVFQFPKTVGLSTDGDGSRIADGAAKKKKKHKATSNTADGLDADIEPKAAKPKKVPSTLEHMEESQTQLGEEAKRKAEKKAKKAAKLKVSSQA